MKSRYERMRKILLFWCLFIGIGAVAGSTGMLVAPDGSALGMDGMLPYFQVLPLADLLYQDFIFPGIALLIVNGITNLVASVLILAKKKLGIILGGIFGVTLMLWICIQFVIFPMNFMSTIYFIFGLLQAVTGLIAYISLKQEEFAAEEKKRMEMPGAYATTKQDAAQTKKTLVAYFSRMGYTKHYAYEWAKKEGADLYEIKATEKIDGDLEFWWCGRFGMHHWEMPIEEITVDLEKYDKVIICTPIWVFAISAPVRAFCAKAAGKIKNAEYVIVHYQKFRYENACEEMDALLGVQHEKATSICVRQGREKRRYEL